MMVVVKAAMDEAFQYFNPNVRTWTVICNFRKQNFSPRLATS